MKRHEELTELYSHLLGDEANPTLIRLVAHLDALGDPGEPPIRTDAAIGEALRARRAEARYRAPLMRAPSAGRMARIAGAASPAALLLVVVALGAIAVGVLPRGGAAPETPTVAGGGSAATVVIHHHGRVRRLARGSREHREVTRLAEGILRAMPSRAEPCSCEEQAEQVKRERAQMLSVELAFPVAERGGRGAFRKAFIILNVSHTRHSWGSVFLGEEAYTRRVAVAPIGGSDAEVKAFSDLRGTLGIPRMRPGNGAVNANQLDPVYLESLEVKGAAERFVDMVRRSQAGGAAGARSEREARTYLTPALSKRTPDLGRYLERSMIALDRPSESLGSGIPSCREEGDDAGYVRYHLGPTGDLVEMPEPGFFHFQCVRGAWKIERVAQE